MKDGLTQVKELKDKIHEQYMEIQELNKARKFDIEYNKYLQKEIIRLNNIINELEKWCLSWKENDKYCYLASNDKDKCRYDIWEEVLDKLHELKGENNE